MEIISCHSNQSSYPIGTKNIDAIYIKKIGFTASEYKSFENVDGRTLDACIYKLQVIESIPYLVQSIGH